LERTVDHNQNVYNEYVHEYAEYRIYPPERAILERFKKDWPRMRMLDIGIGTGRTTYTFAAVAGEYVGIDYAEEMVRGASRIIPASADVTLKFHDARDLSQYYAQPFDFVFFSMNGLDSVSHEDRERIVREVRKVVKPAGHFCFSSHTIRGFKPEPEVRPFRLADPLRSGYYFWKDSRHRARMRATHRGLDVAELRRRDWAVLKTGDHNFAIDIYHVNPVYQIERLRQLGFTVAALYDPDGAAPDPATTTADWLYYLCSPAPVADA
jgi:SAM-dependent methyltransferase